GNRSRTQYTVVVFGTFLQYIFDIDRYLPISPAATATQIIVREQVKRFEQGFEQLIFVYRAAIQTFHFPIPYIENEVKLKFGTCRYPLDLTGIGSRSNAVDNDFGFPFCIRDFSSF